MKGLGRGFESLIPTELIDDQFDPTAAEDKKSSQLKEIKLTEIVRDDQQPRREFNKEAIDEFLSQALDYYQDSIGLFLKVKVSLFDGEKLTDFIDLSEYNDGKHNNKTINRKV